MASFFDRFFSSRRKSQPIRRSESGRTKRPGFETLEDRTVPATLPAATVSPNTTPVFAGGYSPQITVDPLNSQNMVAVVTTGTALSGQYSNDGGTSWNAFGAPTTFQDPNLTVGNNFASITDPSVSFDRTGRFYIVASYHDAAYTSGAIRVNRFDMRDGSPSSDHSSVVYRWFGSDAAYNPVVAVDTNEVSWTDPETGATRVDTLANSVVLTHNNQTGPDTEIIPRGIYVAWNANLTLAAGDPFGATMSRVFVAASGDGGRTFTTQQAASGANVNAANPVITFAAPGTSGASNMLIFWNQGTGIVLDSSDPTNGISDGGVVAAAQEFTNSTPIPIGDATQNFDATPTRVLPDTANPTDSPITVALDAQGLTSIRDVDVTVNITHQDLSQLSISLVPPSGSGLPTIPLLLNRVDGSGTVIATTRGITGTNLGVLTSTGTSVGAVFDSHAMRSITAGSGPFVGHFRPDTGSLSLLNGATAAQVAGQWRLRVTDHFSSATNGATTTGTIQSWSIKFTGRIDTPGIGNNAFAGIELPVATSVAQSNTQTGTALAAAGTLGIGSGLSVAVDRSVGAFSTYAGRIYVAYNAGTAPDSNVFVAYSDNGILWQTTRINDDSASDNMSEGTRSQFMPTIAVDPGTGTLVATYYDARWDAANARATTMVTTSIDGGSSFAKSTYLNANKTAVDLITGATISIEPIPGNAGQAGAEGFGDRQALAVQDGRIIALYASNQNAAGVNVYTADATFAAGPRVVSGDMGPILDESVTRSVNSSGSTTATYVYNAGVVVPPNEVRGVNFTGTVTGGFFTITFRTATTSQIPYYATPAQVKSFLESLSTIGTGNVQVTGTPGAWVVTFVNSLGGQEIADVDMTAASVTLVGTNPGVTVTTNTQGSAYAGGTRQLDGFQVTFDRRIDPTTFDYRDIEMYFRSPTTPGSQLGTALTANETQTLSITGGPTGGTFTLTLGVATTGNIPYNASAVQIQAALESLSTIGKNNVKVTGNVGGPFAVTFMGDLAFTDISPLIANPAGLTGGSSPNVGVAETTKGSTAVLQVIALNNDVNAGGSSNFLVKLAPQSAVGTYSYIVGPNIRDKFRHRDSTIQSPTYATPFNASGGAGIGAINLNTTNEGYKEFTLDLTAAGLTGSVVDFNVRFTGTGTGIRNSDIYLESPTGVRVPLALQNSAIVDGSAVTFDDQATYSLAIAGGVGSVKAFGALSSFNRTASALNGVWKLIVINESGSTGNVDAWGLDIATDSSFGNDVIANAGNWMDQNQNAIQRESASGDRNQTISVSGSPTGGTFRLVYGSEFVDVNYSASNNTTRNAILAALESLNAIAPGDVSVSNSTGNSWIVTFSRGFARTALYTLGVDGSGLTGGSNPSALVTSKSHWDVFAAPTPDQSENPYFPSFDNRTSPLSIPGAHVVTSATYESATTNYSGNTIRDANISGPNGNGVTYSDIVIVDDGTGAVLTDLNVELLLDHARIDDLRLTLIAPDGTQVRLANGRGNLLGGTSDRYADVTFDDSASTSVALYSGISGSYRPEASLSNLLGKKLVGTWRLMIEDLSTGGNGNSQLVKWALQPRTALYLNAVANYIDVSFDRDIDITTFTSADIVSVTGPNGAITGTFGIAANPQGTPVGQERRRFRITFPAGQAVPGWYNLVLGSDIKDTQGNRVDNNLNAGLDVLRSSDPSVATIASWNDHNYSSTASYVTIPANSTVESTLEIKDNFVIQRDANHRIQVAMNITFPDVRDLDISLIAPNGTVIRLSRGADLVQNQANVQNFQGTVLDDADTLNGIAINPIQGAQAPYAPPSGGAYKPVDSLFPLVGMNSAGVWRLRVTNNGAQTGTIGYNNGSQDAFWSLKLPEAIAGSGLGETAADRATLSFRVFVGDSTNNLSSQVWTGTGPFTAENQTNSGPVRTIAVDPSDPSGNTVFLGAADGGVWKTTNFLTDNTAGPTWIPLTDLGPTRSFRTMSITVIGRNGDPNQSIVFVGTGDYYTNRGGAGMLRSADGGKTWTIVGDQANGEVRDTTGGFITLTGSIVNKIVADPTPQAGSQDYILYAAISGTNGGLYRSTNSGLTWQQVRAGNATDVTLVPSGLKDTNGNLLQLWAAFQGDGIYSTSFATSATSLSIQNGGGGVNTRTNNGTPLPVLANTISLTGKGRVLISAVEPSLSNTLGNSLYAGWLYAAVVSATGTLELYLTKDYGLNWTRAVLPVSVPVSPATATFGSNNENNAQVDPFNGQGNLQSSLAVDPSNPNVVYVGGNRVIRVDTTTMVDAYSLINFDNSDPGAGVIQSASTGAVNPQTRVLRGLNPINTDYYNLIRHPDNVLNPNSGTNITLDALGTFANNGTDLKWQAVTTPSTGLLPLSVQQMIVRTDPTTGERRIYYATATGVYTNVVDETGSSVTRQGNQSIVSGARNSNLQIDTVNQGTVIASVTGARAADVFGASFGLVGQLTGLPDDWMQTGNLISSQISFATGAMVQAVLDGSGDWYQYINPSYLTSLPVPQSAGNFFQYADNSVTDQTYIRNGGTLLSAGTGGAGQWSSYNIPVTDPYPLNVSLSKPAIGQNPWDGSSVLLGSPQGRVYLSTGNSLQGKGQVWITVANQGQLSGTSAVSAVAFGAPDTGSANLNQFMYAGTQNGQVFVTTTGGSTWTNITGNLTGGQILGIYANPNRGSREVYAITTTGIWQLPNSTTGTTWTQLNDVSGKGGLLTATRSIFGDNANTEPALRYLTTMAIDWRFAIPNGTGGTFPVLYAAGHGGVYRSIDFGTTWKPYPENAANVTTNPYNVAAGGLLPNVPVLDLNLATGGINYATGFPDQSTAQNVLVAHTLGRGDFSIRLNNEDVEQYSVVPNKGPRVLSIAAVNPNPGNTITGIDVTFAGAVDPYTFAAVDVLSLLGPNSNSIAVGSITSLNPATNGDKVYRILFATPQTASGSYSITLGTDIADYSGNLMNQDNDNINGEDPADRYSNSLTIQLNRAPAFTAIADVVTQPNVATTPFTFTVTDPDPGSGVTVAVTNSSNTTLAPLANISLTPQGNGVYQIIITPATNQYGSSVITLTATDGRGLATSVNFTLFVDTAPAVTFGTDPFSTPHRPLTRTNSITFSDAEQDIVTFGVPTIVGSGPAATLQTQFQFFTTGNNYFGIYGQNEKWFKSQTNGSWYFITPNGQIRRDGGSFGASTLLGTTLTYAYWNDNNLLFTALTPPALTVSVQNVTQANGSGTADLIIDNTASPNFVGSVDITVPYSDGILNRTKTLTVTFTNTTPSVGAVSAQSVSHLAGSLSVAMPVTDAESDPIAFTGSAVEALAYRLDTRYDFFFTGNFYQSANQKWFRSLTQNTWFYITPSGNIYRDGAANPFAQLDASYWTTPAKLFDASQTTTSFVEILSDGEASRLDRQFDFYFTGSYSQGFYGQNEKWIRSAIDNAWYIILPTGELRKANSSFAASTLVSSSLDASYWEDPTKLINASTNAAPAITAAYNSPNLDFAWNPATVSGDALVNVFAHDGISGTFRSFDLDVTNQTPTLAAIADRTGGNAVSHNAGNVQIPLTVSDGDIDGLAPDDTLTYTVTFSPSDAYVLDQQLQLRFNTSYYQNYSGSQNEKWVFSDVNGWYVVLPNGDFKRAPGGTAQPAQWIFVQNLGVAYYNDPSLLFNAFNNGLPAGFANLSGSVTGSLPNPDLNITIPPEFVGMAKVTVKVSDGVGGTATRSFLLESVNASAPVINVIPPGPYTVNNGNTLSLNINAFDTDGDTPTVSVEAVGHYGTVLQKQYQLTSDGNYYFNASGFSEKWLRSGTVASGWVYIKPDGSIWQWGKTVADSQLTTVDKVFYDDQRLLISTTANQGLAYDLDRLGTLTYNSQYDNFNNLNARWFLSSFNIWYYVLPNGDFVRNGGGTLTTLPTSFHTNPLTLQNAYAAGNPAQFTASLAGNQLDVTATAGYLGDIWVLLKATDGNKTTYEAVKVTQV